MTPDPTVTPDPDQKSERSEKDTTSNGHAATEEYDDDDDSGVGLKRTVGLWSGCALIVGTIIGKGKSSQR